MTWETTSGKLWQVVASCSLETFGNSRAMCSKPGLANSLPKAHGQQHPVSKPQKTPRWKLLLKYLSISQHHFWRFGVSRCREQTQYNISKNIQTDATSKQFSSSWDLRVSANRFCVQGTTPETKSTARCKSRVEMISAWHCRVPPSVAPAPIAPNPWNFSHSPSDFHLANIAKYCAQMRTDVHIVWMTRNVVIVQSGSCIWTTALEAGLQLFKTHTVNWLQSP